MTMSDVEPFIEKKVAIRFESGLYEWGILRFWDGADEPDRRLVLEKPQQPKGIWVAPIPFRVCDIQPDGIRELET